MDEAYRDNAHAAMARAEALQRENGELRERVDVLERENRALLHGATRAPIVRHRGSIVVIGLVAVIASILGAAMFILMQLNPPAPPPAGWSPATPSISQPPRRAPEAPSPPPIPTVVAPTS